MEFISTWRRHQFCRQWLRNFKRTWVYVMCCVVWHGHKIDWLCYYLPFQDVVEGGCYTTKIT